MMRETNELVLEHAGRRLGIRMGIELVDGGFHWWDWLQVEQLWTGPVCTAVRAAGYIPVTPGERGRNLLRSLQHRLLAAPAQLALRRSLRADLRQRPGARHRTARQQPRLRPGARSRRLRAGHRLQRGGIDAAGDGAGRHDDRFRPRCGAARSRARHRPDQRRAPRTPPRRGRPGGLSAL